jgi:hypothetical protein
MTPTEGFRMTKNLTRADIDEEARAWATQNGLTFRLSGIAGDPPHAVFQMFFEDEARKRFAVMVPANALFVVASRPLRYLREELELQWHEFKVQAEAVTPPSGDSTGTPALR